MQLAAGLAEEEEEEDLEKNGSQSLEGRVQALEEKVLHPPDEFNKDVYAFAFVVCRAVEKTKRWTDYVVAAAVVAWALLVGFLQMFLPMLVVKEDVFETILHQDITLALVNFFTCLMLVLTLNGESETAERLIKTRTYLGIFLGLFQFFTNLVLFNFSAAYVFAMVQPQDVVVGGLTLAYWATLDELIMKSMDAFGKDQPFEEISKGWLKLNWAIEELPEETDSDGEISDADSASLSEPAKQHNQEGRRPGCQDRLLKFAMKVALPWLAIFWCWRDQRSIPFEKCKFPFDKCQANLKQLELYEPITTKRFCESAARYFSLRSVVASGTRGTCWFDGYTDKLTMGNDIKFNKFSDKLELEAGNPADLENSFVLYQPKYVDLRVPSLYYTLTGGLLTVRRFAVLLAPESICVANHMEDIYDEEECQRALDSGVAHLNRVNVDLHAPASLSRFVQLAHNTSNVTSNMTSRVLRTRSCVLRGFGGELVGVMGSRVLCRMPTETGTTFAI